jgi:hypothetical protein
MIANSMNGLDSDSIVDCGPNPLLASEIPFRYLNGHVAQRLHILSR